MKYANKFIATVVLMLLTSFAGSVNMTVAGTDPWQTPRSPQAPPPTGCAWIIVRRGDTLLRIGARYGVTVTALMNANHMRTSRIYSGQRLCVPVRRHVPPPATPKKPDVPPPTSTREPQPTTGPAPTTAPNSATGTIAGKLGYPGEGVPPLNVYAIKVSGSGPAFYKVATTKNQSSYTLSNVVAGTYNVIAYPQDTTNKNVGAYSKFVTCGLNVSCSDHALIVVTVEADKTVNEINPFDWYAPAGTFPAEPK